MPKISKGRLSLQQTQQGKKLYVIFVTKKGGLSDPQEVPPGNLHPKLNAKPLEELDGLEVDLDIYQGQPRRVRPVGEDWNEELPPAASPATNPKTSKSAVSIQPLFEGQFHNPYNFVPALPRNEIPDNSELADSKPIGHDRYYHNHWTGCISVKLTTITPLLIPDASKSKEDSKDHKTYPIRSLDGKPYLPPTSIKGMLRSAYEAVTNSRFGVFEDHSDRLAYRMEAQNVKVVPARVENHNGKLVLRIMEQPYILGDAAKLPRYSRAGVPNLNYDDSNNIPQHSDPVWVRLNPQGEDKLKKAVITRIRYRPENSQSPGNGTWYKGWVYITGENIEDKKYERVFIESENNQIITLTEEMKTFWRELIKNYQETHKKDLKEREQQKRQPNEYIEGNPEKPAWSRHIYEPNAEELKQGTFCYLQLQNNQVKALLPVILSRRLFEVSPDKLLDNSLLHPAKDYHQLSPADRVFGWVNQQGQGAYKGQLRISSVVCLSNNPITELKGNNQVLAILGQPKPQQFRFYTAKNPQGEPLDNGFILKEQGYQVNYLSEESKVSLRGRKVYPHQGKWNDNTKTIGANNYQEYLRLQGEKDNQNRSIEAWVKPEVEFEFQIHVTNLSSIELGALLWLLKLPDEHCHRLGGAKPLGFGSVQLAILWEKTDLRQGKDWQEFYKSLLPITKPDAILAQRCIEEYKQVVEQAYNYSFAAIPFIESFLKSAKGFEDNKPIHYPRIQSKPDIKGENFKWFSMNESVKGLKLSLPPLINDSGLPYQPQNVQS
ncbi:TIGR03986 family CRISPR-associated RAMP protein [Nostoc sp. C052]|uniref:TIGR03986 family type III CRISPR-associated RAMP protein n=1 Tax=Nostoc sp. C052 TaxID=2576902 RepID=UPI0015C407BC|nr:TIGR03986 family CRISPR-associated RAMP protein [Nostoc sp. C052]QLE40841.1 TIGR03986 family CRISPR-associated RAMP protein [Nostoc sp. C052]